MKLLTDLRRIKQIARLKEAENDRFRIFLKQQDRLAIDNIVHPLNAAVSAAVDCTQCGNCCKSLMINVTAEDSVTVATHLQMNPGEFKEKYIEESEQGKMVINTIPCHFLAGTTCSIYPQRFTDCREFPHLHKPNFTSRLFGTIMYYEMCPIIFNVLERLKKKLHFEGGTTKKSRFRRRGWA